MRKKVNGWIKLHRSLMEWTWYHDHKTLKLFIHFLLKANIKDNEWQGIHIKRGSFVTSRKNLSTETGLTEREVRTALSRLEKTGEITRKTTNKYTLITLINYDNYQNKEATKPPNKAKGCARRCRKLRENSRGYYNKTQ